MVGPAIVLAAMLLFFGNWWTANLLYVGLALMIGVSIWICSHRPTAAANYHNTANCIGSCRNEKERCNVFEYHRNDLRLVRDTCQGRPGESAGRAVGARVLPKGSAQLATDPGTSPEALTAAVAGLGYKATPADAPSTSARGRLLGKALDGWAVATSWW